MGPGDVNDVLAFAVEDHTLLLRPGAERFFLLNTTARAIWDLHQVEPDAAACAEGLAEVFGIPLEAAAADVEATLADWRAQGLLCEVLPAFGAPEALPAIAGDAITRHYRMGSAGFSITMLDSALQQDLPPRIAHFEVAGLGEEARHYHAVPCAGGRAVYRDGALLDVADAVRVGGHPRPHDAARLHPPVRFGHVPSSRAGITASPRAPPFPLPRRAPCQGASHAA